MTSLFRPYITRYLDSITGKRVSKGHPGAKKVKSRAKKWYVRIKNAAGKWDAVPLSPKKEAAAILSGQKHDKAAMAQAGVVDRYEAHRKTPLAQHLKDWQASLEAKECTAKHVQMKVSRVQAIIDHCKFVFLSDISASDVELCLAEFRQKPRFSIQTSNHYLEAALGFTRWLARNKRMADNPLTFLEKGNVALDRRHDRREITGPELAYLFQSTQKGPTRCKLSGPNREMAYCVAAYTGLRASELASLHPEAFSLESEPATVTVEAGYSKHRRQDIIPLHPALVERLESWLPEKSANTPLWPGKWALHNHAGKILKRDLNAARSAWLKEASNEQERELREKTDFLAYRDNKGLYADFHALRHSFVSRIVRAGVKPKVAQALARHSSITLTMDKYAHLELDDAAEGMGRMACIPQTDGHGCEMVNKKMGSDQELSRTGEKDARLLLESSDVQIEPSAKPKLLTTKGKTLSYDSQAPVAQLDRASVYGTEGYRSESCRVYSYQEPEDRSQ